MLYGDMLIIKRPEEWWDIKLQQGCLIFIFVGRVSCIITQNVRGL